MSDEAQSSWDEIRLEQIRTECIVGLYPGERVQPQPIELDASFFLDTRPAVSGGIRETLDYARMAGELRFLLNACRFRMLETAADALCRYALLPPAPDAPRAQVQAVRLRIGKPEAAGGALPSLRVYRRAQEYTYPIETKPFGQVDVVYQQADFGIYRLRIRPGGEIPTHWHERMEEHELVLSAGLFIQGKPVKPGTAFAWPLRFPHRYDNPEKGEQAILCVDTPALIPEDEVEVSIPKESLVLPETSAYYPPEDGAYS